MYLASGKSCSLVLSPNASVRELKAEAQTAAAPFSEARLARSAAGYIVLFA